MFNLQPTLLKKLIDWIFDEITKSFELFNQVFTEPLCTSNCAQYKFVYKQLHCYIVHTSSTVRFLL